METLHIELNIEVEHQTAQAYQRSANTLLLQLQQRVKTWLEQQTQNGQIEIEEQSPIMTTVQDEDRQKAFEAALKKTNRKYSDMLQRLAD